MTDSVATEGMSQGSAESAALVGKAPLAGVPEVCMWAGSWWLRAIDAEKICY